MEMLNLTRINHCVVLDSKPEVAGMLQSCKDYVTWGEIDKETLSKMLQKRARAAGNSKISTEALKTKGYNDYVQFANMMFDGKVKLVDIGANKVFRLSPPRGGYRVTKHPYPQGALGYRGEDINNLIKRMI
jgi:large subunit ribosomal protein L30